MSDSRIHQRIKKFSKFISIKVKEKPQTVFEEEEEEEKEVIEERIITRRHSSYVKRSSIEDSIFITSTPFDLKEVYSDVYHYHTISSSKGYSPISFLPPSSPTMTSPSSALSPPPRQPKSRIINQRKSFSTNYPAQPCLSRSNTLGDYSKHDIDTPISTVVSPSTSSVHYNMNHVKTLIN